MSGGAVAKLLAEKRVIVVCGAGGVGKTTTSASLALAAARAGRRVLVITIDPSKRLAETLGVSAQQSEPTELSPERQRAVGIEAPGSLAAWMLDPQEVSDRTVRRLSTNPAAAEALQALIVAGYIEDFAAEAAIAALVDAGLISELALAEAERTALLAEQDAEEAVSAINAALEETAA